MTRNEIASWVLGFFAVAYLVIRECIKRPSPGDADHATPKEREEALRIRQLRLSQAMQARPGVHLLAGKHYRPVLTKTEPVTAKPMLSAVRGGKR